MSDVTEAPNQDAIADSLLPETEQQVEQPETEQIAEPEQEAQPVEQEQIDQPDETAEDWLPTEQDKVFPDEVYARYAQRYNLSPEQAADPQFRQLLHDKINSDIYIQQQREQEMLQPEEEEEPTLETPQTPQPLTPEQQAQHLRGIEQYVQQRTDPEVAKAFHREFLGVWNLPAEQQPMAFAVMASKFMMNLVNTAAPDLLQAHLSNQLNQVYPDFNRNVYSAHRGRTWDQVRNSDPSYESLPAWGTKEFSKLANDLATKYPALEELGFSLSDESKGGPVGKNALKLFETIAKLSVADKSPQLMALQQAAAQAGSRNARRADVRRSAGNLGSGQSKAASGGTKGSSRFETNDDLFDDETMAMYQKEHGRL
jgi:hypothetical protein